MQVKAGMRAFRIREKYTDRKAVMQNKDVKAIEITTVAVCGLKVLELAN